MPESMTRNGVAQEDPQNDGALTKQAQLPVALQMALARFG